jgi:hypothetical protein
MLTGADLLAKVKELGDASKSDLVHACGYVSTKKDGSERLNFTTFYEALLEGKGVSLGDGAGKGRGKPGRSLSYHTKIQFNGNLLVGKAYTAHLDHRHAQPSTRRRVRDQAGPQADPPGAGGWGRRGGVSGRSTGRFAVLTPL